MTAPAWVWYAAGLVVCVGALSVGMYQMGKQAERSDRLKISIEVLRDRGKFDADIRSSTDADLCRKLGGVFANGECM